MKRVFIIICILTMLFILSSVAGAQTPPPISYKIGGTVTINGILKTQSTFNIYTIEVTKVGGTALVPAAETTSLLASGAYLVDIPVYDDNNTGGATPGETLEIHVYKRNKELSILSPANGEITMGEGGTTNFTVNIVAKGGGSITGALLLLPEDSTSYKIGGTVTINDVVETQATFKTYTIKVTKVGGAALVPAAETTSLLASGAYLLDIPVYDAYHTGGATPGEALEIHVYKGSKDLSILSPANGVITMGERGTTNFSVNIVAKEGSIIGILPILLI